MNAPPLLTRRYRGRERVPPGDEAGMFDVHAVRLPLAGDHDAERVEAVRDFLEWCGVEWESDRDEGIAYKSGVSGEMERANPGDWLLRSSRGRVLAVDDVTFQRHYGGREIEEPTP